MHGHQPSSRRARKQRSLSCVVQASRAATTTATNDKVALLVPADRVSGVQEPLEALPNSRVRCADGNGATGGCGRVGKAGRTVDGGKVDVRAVDGETMGEEVAGHDEEQEEEENGCARLELEGGGRRQCIAYAFDDGWFGGWGEEGDAKVRLVCRGGGRDDNRGQQRLLRRER